MLSLPYMCKGIIFCDDKSSETDEVLAATLHRFLRISSPDAGEKRDHPACRLQVTSPKRGRLMEILSAIWDEYDLAFYLLAFVLSQMALRELFANTTWTRMSSSMLPTRP